jgi:hypothetical protein
MWVKFVIQIQNVANIGKCDLIKITLKFDIIKNHDVIFK